MEKKIANKPAEKPAKKAKAAKPKRSVAKFFKEVIGELKKLNWPTPKELISYTFTVLAFIVLMSIIIGALDLAFGQGLALLPKLNG